MPGPTLVERVVEHDRAVLGAIVLVVAASWAWIVVMARDMYGPMTGASAWMMTTVWDAPHVVLLWTMWAVMMAAMMLPSAAPFVLLYGASVRRSGAGARAAAQTYALATGYLSVWVLFSVGATAVQRLLARQLLVSPMMELTSTTVAAGVLIVAGIYQFTSFKQACLRACQSPLAFMTERWRPGTMGALHMGVGHGLYCLGCCWALMLLLFVGGVMNLTVITALTLLVAVEKWAPFGAHAARLCGGALVAWGFWSILR